MKKKKTILLLVIGILIIITLSLRVTYSYMKAKVEKRENTNITVSTCAKIRLKDNGNSINLENTYPMDDSMGLETKPYEFAISSTCEDYVRFNLYLTSLNDNQIEDSNIHFAITNKNKTILSEGILNNQEKSENDFSTEELKELDIGINGTHKNIYKVYSNNLPFQSESNYQLYLWLDKDANNDTMGQSFQVGLSVKSYNRKETMAEYLIKNKDEALIYHDGSYKDEEGNVTDAFDYSYRYAGASDIVNNFVCLDGGETTENECANGDADLYRIIGLFKNDLNLYEIKLIKYDYATSEQLGERGAYGGVYREDKSYYKGNQSNLTNIGGYYWTSSNNTINEWENSELRKINLNDYYLNTYLNETKHINVDQLIIAHTWSLNGHNTNDVTPKEIYDIEMNKVTSNANNQKNKTIENKISLMYLSDYGYAASPSSTSNWTSRINTYSGYSSSNWIYNGLREWTISHNISTSNNVFVIGFNGNVTGDGSSVYNFAYGVRPCFYLTSSIKIKSGNGTKKEPYRLLFN